MKLSIDRSSLRVLFAIVVGVVLVDQVTKAMLLQSLPTMGSVIAVIPGFFDIVHVRNPGGAFGMFAGKSPALRAFFFLAISGIAAVLMTVFYIQVPQRFRWLRAGLALVIGGAVGNLIDRIRFGEVIDFIDLYVGQWHWPAFNVADSAITVGMGIVVLHVLTNRLPE